MYRTGEEPRSALFSVESVVQSCPGGFCVSPSLLQCFRSQQGQGLDFRDGYLSFFGVIDSRVDHDGLSSKKGVLHRRTQA